MPNVWLLPQRAENNSQPDLWLNTTLPIHFMQSHISTIKSKPSFQPQSGGRAARLQPDVNAEDAVILLKMTQDCDSPES